MTSAGETRGQGGGRRPAGQPLPPDRLDPGHRRLLQHHLADQHGPGVDARTPPRQVPRGAGVPVDDRLARLGPATRRTASCSREPSLPCPAERRAAPTRPGAAPLAFPGCCTRSASCPPPSTGGAGWCCWSVLLAVLGGGAWLALTLLAGRGTAPAAPSAATGAAAGARRSSGWCRRCAAVATPDAAAVTATRRRRRRRGARRARPGRRRPVHRRHDRPRGADARHAPPSAASRPSSCVVTNVSAVPCVRALDKGLQEIVLLDRAGQPDLGEQRLLPGGEQRPADARARRGGHLPGRLGRADQRADVHGRRGRPPPAGQLRAARPAGHQDLAGRAVHPGCRLSCSGRGSRSRPAGTGPRGCRGPGPRRRPRRPAGPRSWRPAASAGRRSGRPAGR